MAETESRGTERRQEHFESLGKQEHAVRIGVWVFIGSEALLFAGLFGLYVAYRTDYPVAFREALDHNNLAIGTVNTALLIISSFTIAWAIHELRHGSRRLCLGSLGATIALGSVFVVLKLYEYSQHFHEGIYPGAYYSYAEMPSDGAKLFFTLYYFMTGLHLLHMAAGLSIVAWLVARVLRRRATREYHPEVEMGGLYWHLVDSIWIFLWPMFYLTG